MLMLTTDELAEFFAGTESPVAFTRRPDAIPGDLRHGWRLASLVLVLYRCWANTASMEQIHVLASSLRSNAARDTLTRWFEDRRLPDDFVVRYDPSLSRTVAIAVACGLAIRKENQSISLSPNGVALARTIWSDAQVLQREKEFLTRLPKKISQKSMRELLAGRY
ncbi:hypothetical protein [Streptomyces pseudovenezuelae]|uniref:hypothetical protein n=1 Tax=Streptomyces pseudovenezuelae TaxID=67350 RepID=UPI0036E9B3EC